MSTKASIFNCVSAGLTAGLLITACGSDAEPDPEPEPSVQETEESTVEPPGSAGGMQSSADDSGQESEDSADEQDNDDSDQVLEQDPADEPEPAPSAGAGISDEQDDDDSAESVADPQVAQEAFESAQQASEQAGAASDFDEVYAVPESPQGLNDLSDDWWVERDEAIGVQIAETMSEHRPAEDFNYEDAQVRAGYLLRDSQRAAEISEYPGMDAAWRSAQECNAETEVHTEFIPVSGEGHAGGFEVVGEFRWVDGDDDCELIQPDFFYLYSISVGDDSLATVDISRQNDSITDRPSEWDM